MSWGNPAEIETKKRIKVALAAYAYEFLDDPIMPDGMFDELAYSIDLSIPTTNPKMDKWFKENFAPDTGQWIHKHPDKPRLAYILHKRYGKQSAANHYRIIPRK